MKKLQQFLLAGLAAILVACPTPLIIEPPPPEAAPNKIIGTLNPWVRGARVLKATSFTNGNVQTLATGTLSQAGIFELTLPATLTNLQPIIGAGSSCQSSLVVTPSDTKGIGLSNLDILTTTNKLSGSLIQTNTNAILSSPEAGRKLVSYLFVDKASTIKGTCIFSGQTQTSDLNLKQGWNVVLLDYTSNTNLRVSTDPIPADVTWRFIPSGMISLNSSSASLEVGGTSTLTATASDDYVYPAFELDWISSNPLVVEVNTQGIATAKQPGNSQVTAKLKNTNITSGAISFSIIGLSASGSTYNIEDTTLGTAISIRLIDGNGASQQEFPITIIGPPTWNNDLPLTATYESKGFGTPSVILSETQAVNGTYTIRKASQTTGGSTFTIDTSKKLAIAKEFNLQPTYSSNLTLTWQAVTTSPVVDLDYQTEIVDATTGTVVQAKQSTFGRTSGEFSGQSLDMTRTYKLRVYTQNNTNSFGNTDPFVGVSVASYLLDFRPLISQIGSRGGLTTGGNSVIINGAFFNLDTKVFFGTTEVTSKSLNGSQSMTVVVPPSIASTVDITLQNTRGTSAISALSKYTYYAVAEFASFSPQRLLKGLNGTIHFLESDTVNSSSVMRLAKVSEASGISRITIPNANLYEARDITLDANGNIWIALPTKFVKVTPSDVISEIALPSGVQPAAIAFGADNNIWFTRTDSFKIGRMQPDGTNLVEFIVPTSNFGGGSFSAGSELTLATDGNIWFTQNGNGIGRISVSGSITILSNISGTGASSILVHDNALWIGSTFGSITRVTYSGDTASVGGCSGSNPVVGSDGYFWCASSALFGFDAKLGRLPISTVTSTATGQTIQVGNSSQVTGIASDSNGKIWFIVGNTIKVLSP